MEGRALLETRVLPQRGGPPEEDIPQGGHVPKEGDPPNGGVPCKEGALNGRELCSPAHPRGSTGSVLRCL